jgi:CheY-like chemotaxis protein
MGAMGVLTKPVRTRDVLDQTFARVKTFMDQRDRRVLLIDGSDPSRERLTSLIGADYVAVTSAATAADALAAVRAEGERPFDLVVTGLELPDKRGFDLIDELAEETALRDVPVIVYSPGELTKKEETHLKRLGQTMVLKDVRSPERLMDEAALFLHRPITELSEERQETLRQLHDTSAVLAGKKVLIVDDDIRNIFAMTSLLEPHKMNILSAETGRGAIEILQNNGDIDVVLMDIMMPDMDGYDTMRAIRKLAKFRSLPIIALTAKAMKGDRERCIEAGASDYISKPVDTDQLLALLRVWLYR